MVNSYQAAWVGFFLLAIVCGMIIHLLSWKNKDGGDDSANLRRKTDKAGPEAGEARERAAARASSSPSH